MPLTDQDLREVLIRAEDIERSARRDSTTDAEMQAVIEAAEEVGFDRTAVEQALRERLLLPMKPPAVGELAFAKSADGKFYVAQVVSSAPGGIRVRFLRGSEHSIPLDDLRPCSFLPGERVVCSWPWWGPWTCTVLSYDATTQQVKLSDNWGETRVFPISEVWINSPRKPGSPAATRMRISATLVGAGAAIGAVLGSIVTALLLR